MYLCTQTSNKAYEIPINPYVLYGCKQYVCTTAKIQYR